MSGPFSSIVNFTVDQFLQRITRLSFLNSMKPQTNNNSSNGSNNGFLFPRHHKQSRIADSREISLLASSSTKELTFELIESAILQAYSHTSRLVCDVNMYQQHQVLSLEKMSKLANLQLQKSRIVGYSRLNEHDPDNNSNSDDSSCEDDIYTTQYDTDDEDYLSDHLFNVTSAEFQGMGVFDSINPALANS